MKKSAAKQRSIRLLRAPAEGDGVGVCCIASGKDVAFYAFQEIPCAIGGRTFALHRLGLGTVYHVRIGAPEECSCECMGFLSKGHCKHLLGLLALVERGVI